jgi:hypothetical protein
MSSDERQSQKSTQSTTRKRKNQRNKEKEPAQVLRDFLHRTGLDDDIEQLVAHVARQGLNNIWKTFTPIEEGPLSQKLPPDEPHVVKEKDNPNDPYVILGVHKNTPPEIMKAVYLAWAKNHHPDVGGDSETFKRVNTAWDEIKKEKGI